MRKSFVTLMSLALFLGVLLTVGCGGGGGGGGGSSPTAPVADGSLADLNGKVTYLGKPVANAAVYLLKVADQQSELSRRASLLTQPEPDFSVLTADGNGYQTTSDANGNYTFAQVPVGTYTLDASISPTIRVSQSVVVGAISSLDLALKPTGSISGKVTLDGNPVQAMVFLQGTSYISITDLSGSFKIMNVPVETTPYTLIPVVPSSNYPASLKSILVAGSEKQLSGSPAIAVSPIQATVRPSPAGSVYTFKSSPVLVTPVAGTNTDLGTLELVAAMGTLTGTALIEGANMHSGIEVSAGGSSTYTDSEGKYTLENVYFGQQTVSFSKYYGSEDYTGSTVVLVDSVATKTVETVTLRPQSATMAKIDVSLIGLTGSNYVSFELWQEGNSYSTRSDSSYNPATFSYTGLEPGTYYVRVYPGSNFTLLNPAAGETDLLQSITVAAGGNASFVAYLQYNKANLTGTISGIDPNFPVSYVSLSPGYSGYVSGNSYSIAAITPGVYTLSVSAPGYTSTPTSVTLATGNNTKNLSVTPNFPIVSAVSYAAPTVTVTGTRLGTSYVYIAPQGGSYSTYTPTTQSATQLSLNVNAFSPGVYTVKAYGADGAVSTGSGNFSKPFSTGPATTTGTLGMTSYTMNWNYLPGATQYLVYMNGTYVTSTTSYSHTFTGLTPNTAYTFGVEAVGNGISNSPRTNLTVTTSRVFNAPVVYDSTRSIGTLVKSFVYDGYLYAIGNTGGGYSIVRYGLANPATPAGAPVALQDPVSPGYSTVRDLYVDATGVYVGWTESMSVYLQKYSLTPTTPVNSYSASFAMAAFGIKLKANNNSGVTAPLQAVSWNSIGVASLTYLNTTLGAVATMAITLPVTPSAMEWTSYTNSGNSPRTALMISDGAGGYLLDSNPAFTASTTTSFSGSAYDLAGSQNLGYAWTESIDSGTVRYVTDSITLVPGYLQAAFDANNRLYTINNNPYSIARYSAVGNREDGIALPNLESPAFGKRVIHYDAVNNQVVVIAPANSNLGVMIFKVQN